MAPLRFPGSLCCLSHDLRAPIFQLLRVSDGVYSRPSPAAWIRAPRKEFNRICQPATPRPCTNTPHHLRTLRVAPTCSLELHALASLLCPLEGDRQEGDLRGPVGCPGRARGSAGHLGVKKQHPVPENSTRVSHIQVEPASLAHPSLSKGDSLPTVPLGSPCRRMGGVWTEVENLAGRGLGGGR